MDPIDLCERGFIPDALTRIGVRRIVAKRLADEALHTQDASGRAARFANFVHELRESPIAIETRKANEQHYEVPAEFFHQHLGPRLKYSCCLYPSGRESLAQAEEAMLDLYTQRAELKNGQRILDLGCGWGSLSLYLAERYPKAQIVGLSNSQSQRVFIERRAAERGLTNLQVLTDSIVSFDFDQPAARGVTAGFDRVLSIEMFEHMKNYELLMAKLARWLLPDGKLFVHLFAHKTLAYHYDTVDHSDWMARYFFTGGTMPSSDLLPQFQADLRLQQQWWLSGEHYQKTAGAWLMGLDRNRTSILRALQTCYGPRDAPIWFQRWRMFYIAVQELFGYRGGSEWGVAHYLFEPQAKK